ncbi:alpha/beta fold hydrolase [Ancylobacter oerskovii]|uniref:Alpha/beta fold hydrolase n=1 Tax=Ancylobacter oerskovii TaxID=459519 RepID=A0ABW4YY68_9HYPH|nr:alpha/beta hydrolase [Ancylobacter oerskovii]MBS7541731.1 alpha/beta hydrolase [Ancylobacter oerskovii]
MRHLDIDLDGTAIFYREDGPRDAPALLLPHGYPGSSYQFRRLMPALADRWRTLAPDFPGFGYSATPDSFGYDFDAYASFLAAFTDRLGLSRYALWLHDYGSQIGLRHAIAHPGRIAALIIQNGDIYADALGPKYAAIQRYWAEKSPQAHRVLEEAVSEEGFRHEFIGEVDAQIAERVPPDLWKLHWPLMDTPARRALSLGLMEKLEENLAWFPRYQAYLRAYQPPTLIVWGPKDGYMPAEAALAYRRDVPEAELHLIDGAGHWLLETHFDAALPLVRDFLGRVHAG